MQHGFLIGKWGQHEGFGLAASEHLVPENTDKLVAPNVEIAVQERSRVVVTVIAHDLGE